MGGIVDSIFGGGDDDMPVVEAQNPSRTAEKAAQSFAGADRNRRMAASMITRGWDEPTLSKKGLLGG